MAVIKFIVLEGSSYRSWSDAARNAVSEASRTIRNIDRVDVINSWAKVEEGKIVEYRVKVQINFTVERATE
jgi:hypothetical protein